jgi:hypothetical protein
MISLQDIWDRESLQPFSLVMVKSQPNRPIPASADLGGPEENYFIFFKRMPTRFET